MLAPRDSLPISLTLLDSRKLAVTIEARQAGTVAFGHRGESDTTRFLLPLRYGPFQNLRSTSPNVALKSPGEQMGIQKDGTTAFSNTHSSINPLTLYSINPPMAGSILATRKA